MEDIQFNKHKLSIIGAGGLGRELLSWVKHSQLLDKYILNGFIDDNDKSLDNISCDLCIIGKMNNKVLSDAGNVIIAIANSNIKKKIFEDLHIESDLKIISFIYPNVVLGDHSVFGRGIVVFPFCVISCNVQLGDGVFVNSGSQIGHDSKVGNYSSIMANVDIGGGAQIGENVFIGSGAIILPGVKICDNVKIGAGAIVLRNIKKEGTYFGNPAKKIF